MVTAEAIPEEGHVRKIATYFKRRDKNCIVLSRLLDDLVERTGWTHTDIARKTGMSDGAVSHYRSLTRLPFALRQHLESGRLAFRVGRELGRAGYSDTRRIELAQPFMDGTLSTVSVDRYFVLARKYPHFTSSDIVDVLVRGKALPRREPAEAPKVVGHPPPERVRSEDVNKAAIHLLSLLMTWEPKQTIEDLQAASTLKRVRQYIDA